MTSEQVIKWWKEIEAFKNGKVIQFANVSGDWHDDTNPSFTMLEYRIKPEPELIPFDYSDAEFLIGKAVKHKKNKNISLITTVYDQCVIIDGNVKPFYSLSFDYTFLDGSACGKIKQ